MQRATRGPSTKSVPDVKLLRPDALAEASSGRYKFLTLRVSPPPVAQAAQAR